MRKAPRPGEVAAAIKPAQAGTPSYVFITKVLRRPRCVARQALPRQSPVSHPAMRTWAQLLNSSRGEVTMTMLRALCSASSVTPLAHASITQSFDDIAIVKCPASIFQPREKAEALTLNNSTGGGSRDSSGLDINFCSAAISFSTLARSPVNHQYANEWYISKCVTPGNVGLVDTPPRTWFCFEFAIIIRKSVGKQLFACILHLSSGSHSELCVVHLLVRHAERGECGEPRMTANSAILVGQVPCHERDRATVAAAILASRSAPLALISSQPIILAHCSEHPPPFPRLQHNSHPRSCSIWHLDQQLASLLVQLRRPHKLSTLALRFPP